MAQKACNHSIMSRLINDLEQEALKSKLNKAPVNVQDLLILIAYARNCEAVIQMMDQDPSTAIL